MKNRLLALIMAIALCACMSSAAYADLLPGEMPVPPDVTVNGADAEVDACYNEDGALCIKLIPVAKAMEYSVELNSVTQDDMCRYVISMLPASDSAVEGAAPLMVAYSLDENGPAAVAVSKNQILLPLKQSMTVVDGEPYMPSEFFITGMCLELKMDEEANTLDIVSPEK